MYCTVTLSRRTFYLTRTAISRFDQTFYLILRFTFVQLCDFGLARSARPPPNMDDSSNFLTEYVATRLVYVFPLQVWYS
jgi:hypothetical protein